MAQPRVAEGEDEMASEDPHGAFDRQRDLSRDLGRQLADAARGFFVPTSLEQTLAGVTSSVRSLIPGAETVSILIVEGRDRFESHASTSTLAERLDEVQELTRQGPCIDAAINETIIRSADLENEDRWPEFTRRALELGIRSLVSYRLFTREDTVGALNIFALEKNAFDVEDEDVGEMLSAHAALALQAANTTDQFRSALASRDIIGQAKGMLMERFSIDAVRAFDILRTFSQNENVPVAELAAQIVEKGPDVASHPASS